MMIVMGGNIGSGIFMNPAVVAQQVPNTAAILGLWLFGGAVAIAGAFVYADLAARSRPIRVPARWVASIGCVPLWVVLAVGDSNRRNGGGSCYIRTLLSGDDRLSMAPCRYRRSESRQFRPKLADGSQNSGHPGSCSQRVSHRSAPGVRLQSPPVRQGSGRCSHTGAVRVRWMANCQLSIR